MVTLAQLADMFGGEVQGDGSTEITRITSLESGGEGDIAPAGEERFRRAAKVTNAAALLVSPELAEVNDAPKIVHRYPLVAANGIIEHFGLIEPRRPAAIHPTAIIDATATVGPDCRIGPFVVIEAGAVIGARCEIQAHVTIERGVILGDDCRIEPGAVLHCGLQAGHQVVVGANSVISRQGFGYGQGPTHLVRLHHIGRVVLEDGVEIGALTAVDRARYDVTRIGTRSGFDNLCQIAHNSVVGKHSFGAAQVGLAGRSVIGDFCQLGGQSAVALGATLGDHSKLGAQAGLIKSAKPHSDLWGTPAQSKLKYLRQLATGRKLTRKQYENK